MRRVREASAALSHRSKPPLNVIDGIRKQLLYHQEKVLANAPWPPDGQHLIEKPVDEDVKAERSVSVDLSDDLKIVLVSEHCLHQHQIVTLRNQNAKALENWQRRIGSTDGE